MNIFIIFPKVNVFSASHEEVSLSVTWSSSYLPVPYKLEIVKKSFIIIDGKCAIFT